MGKKPTKPDNISKHFLMDRQIQKDNTYVERLQKLVPLEVTALYIFISKIATKTEWEGLLGILLIVLVVALWPYVTRYQNVKSPIQKIIIIVSFLLWISYTDPELMVRLLENVFDSQPIFRYFNATPLGMIVAVWTFLIPLLAPNPKNK